VDIIRIRTLQGSTLYSWQIRTAFAKINNYLELRVINDWTWIQTSTNLDPHQRKQVCWSVLQIRIRDHVSFGPLDPDPISGISDPQPIMLRAQELPYFLKKGDFFTS
jgi:hypothetical protein